MLDVTQKIVDAIKDKPIKAEAFNKAHEIVARNLRKHKKDLTIEDMYSCLKSVFCDLVYATDRAENIIPYCNKRTAEAIDSREIFFDFGNLEMKVTNEKEKLLFAVIDLLRYISYIVELQNLKDDPFPDVFNEDDDFDLDDDPLKELDDFINLIKPQEFLEIYCGAAIESNPLKTCDLPSGAWNIVVKTENGSASISGTDSFTTIELLELKSILAGFAVATQKKACVVRFCFTSMFLRKLFENDLIEKWEENDWNPVDNVNIPNLDMIKSVAKNIKDFDCEFCFLKEDAVDQYMFECLNCARKLAEEKE